MKKIINRIVQLILFSTLSLIVKGQAIEFDHFTDEHGLVSSHVTAVIQDREGFIWIATRHGLDKYDGYTCKHFLNEPANTKSIPENNIRCLYESRDGKIYIGFYGRGFSIYDKRKDLFENYCQEHGAEPISHDTVYAFLESKDGMIWMGTSAGLDKFDPKEKKVYDYFPFNQFEKAKVSSLAADKEGNIWLYGPSNRPCKLNLKDQMFHYLIDRELHLKTGSNHEGAILLDKNNNLWFGNEWDGLCKLNLSTKVLKKFQLQNGHLHSNQVNCITEDAEGSIWVGTEGAGVFKYNSFKHNFELYQYVANLPNNLNSNNISYIYESQPGIVWIAGSITGLNVWKKHKKKFYRFGVKGDDDKRLNSQSVLGIAEAPEGKVWLGTDGGGLNLFDPKTLSFEYYTAQNSPICHNSIKSIVTDNKGKLWYGAFELGLCNINPKTGAAANFREHLVKDWKRNFPNCAWTLCKTSDNKLWIGLIQGGIKIYDLNKNKFVDLLNNTPEFKKLISSRIQVIKEDRNKRIWIGTEQFGAICYNPTTQQYTNFYPSEEKHITLKSKNIKTIFEDRDGRMWFGTHKGGLSKLVNFDKKAFLTYTMADGLPNNNIKDIVEDGHGNLWLGTEKGVSCFYRSQGVFRNFDMEDGLQGSNFHSNSNYKSKDGFIYLGGIDGFNFFHPDSIKFNNQPPKVALTDFKIFNQSLRPNHKLNDIQYIDSAVSFLNEITLHHSDYVFSIEFSALDYVTPEKNKYAYKLHGFNDKWTYVGHNHRIASYTNLDPGEYTFMVKACNSDGVWNEQGASLKIIIKPPFYLTWWFKTLCGSLVVSGLFLFFFIRERNVRSRNKFLEREVNKRTLELKERNEEILKQHQEILQQRNALEHSNKTKDKFFSIIGHDLKNPVIALNILIKQLKENFEERNSTNYKDIYIHIERSAERIQSLVLSLLEWAKTQTGSITVQKRLVSLKEIIHDTIELLSEQAATKEIAISCNVDSAILILADANMMSTIIRNIISNSIKFTPNYGTIKIAVKRFKDGRVKIAIEDSGVGMTKETKDKLFKIDQSFTTKGTNQETGTGLGMLICHEFVMLHEGKLEVESEPGKGSTFYITLPSAQVLAEMKS